MAYAHKFDISLIPRVLSDAPPPAAFSRGISGAEEVPGPVRGVPVARRPEEGVLRAFRLYGERPVHVVEIASEANLEFDEALKGVLRLVARGELDLRQRDSIANDHLVALTPRGEDALNHVLG